MDSQKVFIVFFAIFAATALSKPFTIDIFEASDALLSKPSDLVKRTTEGEGSNDVAELSIPKISLTALIDNIETGLVQTALSVGSVANDPNAKVEVITPSHAISKRSADEEVRSASDNSSPVVLSQTTEKVLADDTRPSHVVIDRVSVYKAPVAGALLFPTFHFQETIVSNETGEVIAEIKEDRYVIQESTTTKDSDSNSSSSESESSEESSEKTKIKGTSTTTISSDSLSSSTITEVPSTQSSSSSSTPSSSSSTVPTKVDEKKTIEKELKEKVAEVEAEPVILTARV